MRKRIQKKKLLLMLTSCNNFLCVYFLVWVLMQGQGFCALSFTQSNGVKSNHRSVRRSAFARKDSSNSVSVFESTQAIQTRTHTYDKCSSSDRFVQAYQKLGILYRPSILTPEEFHFIRTELFVNEKSKKIALSLKEESSLSIATNRLGAALPSNSRIVEALQNPKGSMYKFVNRMLNCNTRERDGDVKRMVLATNIPVEIRVYETEGAGMDWHKDDILYEPPQVEVVLTVENTSDCVAVWEVSSKNGKAERTALETEPNSAIFLRAGGALHSVSPLKHGRRIIIKFVYIQEGAVLLEEGKNHVHQFGKAATSSHRNNKKRQRQ